MSVAPELKRAPQPVGRCAQLGRLSSSAAIDGAPIVIELERA